MFEQLSGLGLYLILNLYLPENNYNSHKKCHKNQSIFLLAVQVDKNNYIIIENI